MGSLSQSIPAFLEKVVDFPDGRSYEILKPLTDLRKCHDGRPLEARIVFTCRQVVSGQSQVDGIEYVMKVKIQVPDNAGEQPPVEGPSTTTNHELKALEIYTKAQTPYTPHLVSWKKAVQGSNSMFPAGYLSYIVMTKMPGQDLLASQFWSMTNEGRQEIIQGFLEALRAIYDLGVEPVDCALRNVLWEPEARKCTIIDFELWREATETFPDERKELERWGLARRKPPISWWAEWNTQGR